MIIYFSIFSRDFVPMLEVSLHSLLKLGLNHKIYAGLSNLHQHDLNILKYGYPTVTFIDESDIHLKKNRLHSYKASQKLQRWKNFYDQYPVDGDYILFCDADLIFYGDFGVLIDKESNLMITKNEGRFMVNTGVVGMKKCCSTSTFFEQWVSKNSEVLSNKKFYQQANEISGGADQHSLIEVLNLQRVSCKGIDEIIAEPDSPIKIQIISGDLINKTKSSPVTKESRIYHVKSGFHRILLKRGSYTKLRSEKSSKEIVNLWEGLYQEAKSQSIKRFIMSILYENTNRFDLSNEKYLPNGIFMSEMFMILSLVVSLKIDLVVESGRGSGFSTEILCKYLNPYGVKIISIERDRSEFQNEVSRRLQKFTNLELLFGDSIKILPKIIKRHSQQKIGILIDGPKGYNAVKTLKKLIIKNEKIIVGIIHDMRKLDLGKPSSSRFYLENEFDRTIFSDDNDFVQEIRFMDDSVWLHNYENSLDNWRPYTKGFQFVGSYGPTLGIVFPTVRDLYGKKLQRAIDLLKERAPQIISVYSWKRRIKKLFIK